jgi:hypothetical protein
MNLSNTAFKVLDTVSLSGFQHFLNYCAREQQKILSVLFCTLEHFFESAKGLFSEVKDRRYPGKTEYSVSCLAFVGVLMYLLRLSARRQVGLLLRTPASVETCEALFGVSGFLMVIHSMKCSVS